VNYHYVEETLRISSSLYDEAKKIIKNEQKSLESAEATRKEQDATQKVAP